MKIEKEFNLEERVARLERKIDFIFEIIEDIKYDLDERKLTLRIEEAKIKKEDVERLLKDLEMQQNYRWERKQEDSRRYYHSHSVYETTCEHCN